MAVSLDFCGSPVNHEHAKRAASVGLRWHNGGHSLFPFLSLSYAWAIERPAERRALTPMKRGTTTCHKLRHSERTPEGAHRPLLPIARGETPILPTMADFCGVEAQPLPQYYCNQIIPSKSNLAL